MKIILKVLLCFAFLSHAVLFAEEKIKLGAIFSLSGWGSIGGTSEFQGAQLAVEEINKRGGINGREIQLIVEDNGSDFKKAASAYQKLVTIDKVVAVVGPNWAEFTEIVAPLAKRYEIPTITPSGHRADIFVDNPFIFTLLSGQKDAVIPLAKFIKALGYKRISVVLAQNRYFEEVFTAIKSALAETDIHLEPVEEIGADVQDFRSVLLKIRAHKTDALLSLLIENVQIAPFLKQYKELKLSIPHINGGAGVAHDEHVLQHPALAEGVVYYNFMPPKDSRFLEMYRARYHKAAPIWCDRAYDAVQILARALNVNPESRGKDLAATIAKSSFVGTSTFISFDANGVIIPKGAITALYKIVAEKEERLS